MNVLWLITSRPHPETHVARRQRRADARRNLPPHTITLTCGIGLYCIGIDQALNGMIDMITKVIELGLVPIFL